MKWMTLKKSNCKNCYKCIRYCPVKSIRFSGNQAHIIDDECILCGRCFVVCPQNAKEIKSEVEKVKVMLQSGEPVIVSLAPSFVANYDGVGINAMRTMLKKLGFSDVEETAIGATIVKNEYERILREENRDVVITSCCHSVNLLIQKYFPNLMNLLADVLSPMLAHGQDIKKRNPNAKVVFIGPCIAKKDEADHYAGCVDAVLTFEELSAWFKDENISIIREMDEEEKSRARLFPTKGGVLKTMEQDINGYTYVAVDGVRDCIAALKNIANGKIHKCLIEMNTCEGSCINGPAMEKHNTTPIEDYIAAVNYAGEEDFDVAQPEHGELRRLFTHIEKSAMMPSEVEIQSILRKLGKTKPSDELNCGSCGYDSCREKAIAIYQGKSDFSMCLPYLKDKAENFSSSIIKNMVNGVIVVNENLEVQQINPAARRILNIRNESDILGDKIIRVLDPTPFMKVIGTGRDLRDEFMYLAEYKRYVEMSILRSDDAGQMLCSIRDVTSEQEERTRKEEISRRTAEVADKVIDKQMRIVQEIASLLGETAAETKIALVKLKESLTDE